MSLAASQTDAPSRRRLSASSVMMVASLVLLASPTLIVIARQSWTDEQSQQGPLVLALGVWLFWRGWPDALAGGGRGGLAASVAGMAVCGAAYCLGRLSELSLLEGYGLFGFGLASVYALTGVYGLRRAAFPLMLIGFAMPVPFMVGWPVTTALRLAISDITVQFMRACHVPASRDGLTLYLLSYRIEIAQACSGMNSLLALTALSICYVHLRRDPPVRYLLVLFSLVVIGAVAANLLRVLLLATLTLVAGDGVAQSSMHQLLGLATFAFALLMTFAADEALGRTAWAHRITGAGMTTSSRREVLVATASLSVSALAFAAEPRRVSLELGRDRLTELIPTKVGMRTGTPDTSVVPESVDAAPSNDDSLSRSYTDAASPPIMLLVSYHAARSRELKVHRPETCYGVAGFDVTARHPVELTWRPGSSVPCVAFQGRRGDRTEMVLYWTRVADSFPQTLSAQRAAFLRQALAGVRADGLLVRLSTIDTDGVGAPARLARFGADLIASVHGAGRKLLLGSAYGT